MRALYLHEYLKPFIKQVKKKFKADELNHFMSHGFPDGCSKCEKAVMKMPDIPDRARITHDVWVFIIMEMYHEETVKAWKDEMDLEVTKTHEVKFTSGGAYIPEIPVYLDAREIQSLYMYIIKELKFDYNELTNSISGLKTASQKIVNQYYQLSE